MMALPEEFSPWDVPRIIYRRFWSCGKPSLQKLVVWIQIVLNFPPRLFMGSVKFGDDGTI